MGNIKTTLKYTLMALSTASILFLIYGCASDHTSGDPTAQSINDFTSFVSDESPSAEEARSQTNLTTPGTESAVETSTTKPSGQAPFEPDYFYGKLTQPVLILDNIVLTSETMELDYNKPYTKATCHVYYCNYPDPKYNIDTVFIPSDIADSFAEHEMVMLSVHPTYFDGSPLNVPLGDEKGNIGYLPFDNGKLSFQEWDPFEEPQDELTATQRVFRSIYDVNASVDILPSTHGSGRDWPRLKICDGMTLQEVIDFFETYKEWDEYLNGIYQKYRESGIAI